MKLALVCRGESAEALLDSFSVERSAVGAEVLKAAGRLTMVGTMRNHTAQAVRNLFGRLLLGLTPVRKAMVDTMSEVSIGYDHSPLNGPGLHRGDLPAPGRRLEPVARQTPVGSGNTPRFALFAAGGSRVSALAIKFSNLIDAEIRAPLDPSVILLVRPDGYVACAAEADNVGVITDYLGAIDVAKAVAA
jgi:hypothetical protein